MPQRDSLNPCLDCEEKLNAMRRTNGALNDKLNEADNKLRQIDEDLVRAMEWKRAKRTSAFSLAIKLRDKYFKKGAES